MIYSMGSEGQKHVISAFLELVKNSSTEILGLTWVTFCAILYLTTDLPLLNLTFEGLIHNGKKVFARTSKTLPLWD